MNCREVIERLSAYHDGELSASRTKEIAEHIGTCASCRKELRALEKISEMFSMREVEDEATPSAEGWDQIRDQLDSPRWTSIPAPLRKVMPWNRVAWISAAAVILLSLGLATWWATLRPADHHRALDLSQFLVDFRTDPQHAQARLVADFQGRPTTLTEARAELSRSFDFIQRVPQDYSLESLHLLTMPCCTCLEAVYRRPDGSLVCLFEHAGDAPIRVSDCPSIKSQCCGRDVQMVQVGDKMMASWKSGTQSLTAVGLADVEEVVSLISSVEESSTEKSS